MSSSSREHSRNPLEVIGGIAARNDWPLRCSGDDQLTMCVRGKCANYQLLFTWIRELEIFHVACAFEIKIPKLRRSEVQKLIGRINERLWLGHFELWMEEGTIMFRESILLVGGASTSIGQCEAMLDGALDACERYYPAVLAAKTAGEALKMALFETVGEA